jgi:polynucleotide 5'-kinase involved in rRNA processing
VIRDEGEAALDGRILRAPSRRKEGHRMIEVPQAWADAVSRIGAASWRRLAVLGERDQGKSTFCRVLLERLELFPVLMNREKLRPIFAGALPHRQTGPTLAGSALAQGGAGAWLLDADVGQKMIGPPACVTLAEAQA